MDINTELRNWFASDWDIPVNRSQLFNLQRVTDSINQKTAESLTPDQAAVLIYNLQDSHVVSKIAQGDYSLLDVYNRAIFNDSYEDMIDDLNL